MKKTLLLSALLIALVSLVKPEKASATITGVTVSYIDSVGSYCHIPTRDNWMLWGSATGSYTTSDSLTIYINFDDGSDTTFTIAASSSYYSTGFHNYTMPGTYFPYAQVTATGGAFGTSGSSMTLTNDCARLQGKLYVDDNSNCVPDAGEAGISYMPILVVNTSSMDTTIGGWSNDTGHYAMDLMAGYGYNIIPYPSLYSWWWWYYYAATLSPSCPSTGTYSLTAASSGSYTENFAYSCTAPDSVDVMVNGYNWCYVPGDTSYVEVWVGNWWWWWGYSCTSLSTTMTLHLDSKLTYAGTPSWATAPTTVSGGTLTWNYTSGGTYFGFWTVVKVLVSTTASIGDSVCNTVSATATSLPDPNMSNNSRTFCHVVSSSYDPNEKAVSPQGSDAPGYINNGTPLSYSIHFQNTGTAPARNVTVVDTLSPNVDPKTLHVFHSSAPVTIYTSGNIVKFRFDNINLPDSATNPEGSIGSVEYGVMPKQGLPGGTQIKNKAAIFFDYNPAVWTNQTLNTIFGTTAVQHIANSDMKATVYPNPATDVVYAKTENKSDFTMTMTDVLGRMVGSSTSVNGTATLHTNGLANGLYVVKLTSGNGKELTTKVTIQR